jgi:hypothetical protein
MADPSETTQVSLGSVEPEAAELLDAIKSVSTEIESLQSELRSLRAQARALPAGERELPGWDERLTVPRESSPWMRSLDHAGPRQPGVPRLLLEVVFLVVVAGAAAIASLDPIVIVALMLAAWALVAVTEWLADREARRKAELSLHPLSGGAVLADDPSWFRPPVERRPLEPVPEEDEDTEEGRTPHPSR